MSCTIAKNVDRTFENSCRVVFTLALMVLLLGTASSGQAVFNSLVGFNGADGRNPYYVDLVQGTDGQLYGTTLNGYECCYFGAGTVFKVTTTGTLTDMYTFALGTGSDGDLPVGGLVLAPNGNFYGTASEYGLTTEGACDTGIYGCGTIFEITPTGTLTVLHTFSGPDGFAPYANLTLGTDGNLYGTTLYGGNQSASGCSGIGCGTVFKVTLPAKGNPTFTSLYSFCSLANCADGSSPVGRLFQAANGNFYGTNSGTIFEITPTGKLTTVYTFGASPNGSTPYGGLIQGTDGNFYGTTLVGGVYANGTVFELTLKGKLTTLYSFCAQPQCADGSGPLAGLLQATDGNFYGTTEAGGGDSDGTVFSVSTGLGPFVQSVTSQGKVGASVTILGTNLTGATALAFGTTAATIKTNSGTAITTTVPAGATTALISVTTPAGTLNSNTTFKVLPQITKFSPTSGAVGTVVTITGVSLSQTSSVTFGGVKATSFTVNSDTQVTATVPSGAKTGKIATTTPGGTASSVTNFTVT